MLHRVARIFSFACPYAGSRRAFGLLFALALISLSSGCDAEYLSHVTFGQLNVLSRIVPINKALSDPKLTDDERIKLALAQQIRIFGIERIGLKGTDSYTVFDFNGQQPAAWVVSASAKDSLTPFLWDYPIIGRFSTRGFFDEAYGRRVADELTAQGYDVFFGRAAGFSTLNFFPDPVRQSNLQTDTCELAELILHEMLHQTIYKFSDGNFNESMATFVGRTAAQAFFDETYGPNSPEAMDCRVRFTDKRVIDAYVSMLYSRMTNYYSAAKARGDSKETIIAGREAEFEAGRARYTTEFEPRLADPEHWAFNGNMTLNNARLLAGIAYQGDLSDFEAVFAKVGNNFAELLRVLAEAAKQTDSRAYLRNFAAAPM